MECPRCATEPKTKKLSPTTMAMGAIVLGSIASLAASLLLDSSWFGPATAGWLMAVRWVAPTLAVMGALWTLMEGS